MGILQEYKFFLIIAIIALVGIISLFFNTQKSQEYVDFTTNLQASYAQIKGTASDTKDLGDVISIDWVNVKGLKNNSLFGLTLDGNASAIKIADEYDNSAFPGIEPTPAAGKYAITFATTSAFTAGDTDWATIAVAATIPVVNEALVSSTVDPDSSSVAKGWDLDTNGYVLYTFEDVNTARDVIDQFLPEGSLIGTSTVSVKLIR